LLAAPARSAVTWHPNVDVDDRERRLGVAAPVLLLDAAGRIDRVIDAERACELLVMNRAVPASEEIATVMHSPSLTVEVPSVIARLGVLHPCELRPPTYSPRRVRLRDGHLCQFVISGQPCGRRGDSVDHLLPRSLGGDDSWLNVVAACRAHNGTKSHRTLDQMHHLHGWSLRRLPFIPTRTALVAAALRDRHPAWEPFLVAS
jgi:5-methylcytosine-specific restriction endonuclease McrA